MSRLPFRAPGARPSVLLAAFFLAFSVFFSQNAEKLEEKTAALAAENDAAAMGAPSAAPRDDPFAFPPSEFSSLPEYARQSGVSIDTVSEEEPEREKAGDILKMKLAGRGTFFQVLSLFDIIHMKKHWVSADLLHLKREDDLLAFEAEFRAYRSRGTYEKEKHRTDRSDGDGEEPRRQNSR